MENKERNNAIFMRPFRRQGKLIFSNRISNMHFFLRIQALPVWLSLGVQGVLIPLLLWDAKVTIAQVSDIQ